VLLGLAGGRHNRPSSQASPPLDDGVEGTGERDIEVGRQFWNVVRGGWRFARSEPCPRVSWGRGSARRWHGWHKFAFRKPCNDGWKENIPSDTRIPHGCKKFEQGLFVFNEIGAELGWTKDQRKGGTFVADVRKSETDDGSSARMRATGSAT